MLTVYARHQSSMETDAAFYQIFERNPDRLEELTGLTLPKFAKASSQALKAVQVECDLLFEPAVPGETRYVLEVQMYFDQSIFNRIELARSLIWKRTNPRTDCKRRGYAPSQVRGIVIFGDQIHLPPDDRRHPDIEYFFLEDLIRTLETRQPDSPLLSVLPLITEPDVELEKHAARRYRQLTDDSTLTLDEREALDQVFHHLLSQRFKDRTIEELKAMIAELVPFEETAVGRELLEMGLKKGRDEGREQLVRSMSRHGQSVTQIAELTGLDEEAVRGYLNGSPPPKS